MKRRPRVETDDAPFAERPILGTVGRAALTARRLARGRARLRLGRQSRHAPVGRVNDDRRLSRAGHLRPAVVPRVVIRAVHIGRGAALPVSILAGTRRRLLFELLHFLIGEHRFVAKRRRPFERRDSGEAPVALQIGMSVRCSRRRPGLGRATRLRRDAPLEERHKGECHGNGD